MTVHAVIGTGYWGTNHVRVAAELAAAGEIDELLLCDVAEERVADLAESYGVEYVTDHAELAGMGVDTAVVATPSVTHHDIATDLLGAGVDLLVEKPLALTSGDAWEIVDTAREHDRTLGVGHIFRFHPALSELRRRVERGELGRLKYLSTNRYAFREPRAETGALYSLAVHDLDIYTMLLGRRPDTIHCRLDRHLRPDVDETASLLLGYEGPDATGVIEESWQVPAFGKRRDLVAVGTERAAYIDYLADTELELFDAKVVRDGDRLRARDEGSTTYEVEGYEPLKAEVEDFLTAARSGREPGAPGRVGAETVELLEHAERSDRRGETVRLD
jgi:predicted dehydrogenase